MNDRKTMAGKPVYDIPSATVLNLNSGFKEKLLCDGPTFSAGICCNASCSFCFVPAVMRKHLVTLNVEGKHEDIVVRRQNATDTLLKQLTDKIGRPKYKHPLDRRVIYASPLVDVAGNMELTKETIAMVDIIMRYTYWQVRLLSKSNLLPKIAQAFDRPDVKGRIIYGVSTGTLNDDLAKVFEQGTALVSKRLESLYWLQDNGFRTFGMICPSLPFDNYKRFADEAHRAIRADLCEHVWAEILNVRGESMARTRKALSEGGFEHIADAVMRLSDKVTHESYARATFEAHRSLYKPGQLRYLQYVTRDTYDWWKPFESRGAVLLGAYVKDLAKPEKEIDHVNQLLAL